MFQLRPSYLKASYQTRTIPPVSIRFEIRLEEIEWRDRKISCHLLFHASLSPPFERFIDGIERRSRHDADLYDRWNVKC